MPFMLKLQWGIKAGREASFRANQEALCRVMLEHPGVICYHADSPSPRVRSCSSLGLGGPAGNVLKLSFVG